MSFETGNDTEIVLRLMREEDLATVVKLERELFSDPWPRSAFQEQLDNIGWGAIVAESDSRIIGYACYYVVGDESHLTNIAVVDKYRRKSVAKRLLDNILRVVTDARCEFLLLEVRPSNAGAIAFYEKYDFKVLYRRPGYYRRPIEDALVMVRYLTSEEDGR